MKRKDLPGYLLFLWLVFLILFLSAYQNVHGQREPLKVILTYSAQITLDAVSDAYIAKGTNLVLAHSIDAINIGSLLVSPLWLDMHKGNWYWYLLTYGFLRAGMFDPIYYHTRGLPWNYRTDVSYWDRWMTAINPPPSAELFGRGFCITVGIAIPLTELR